MVRHRPREVRAERATARRAPRRRSEAPVGAREPGRRQGRRGRAGPRRRDQARCERGGRRRDGGSRGRRHRHRVRPGHLGRWCPPGRPPRGRRGWAAQQACRRARPRLRSPRRPGLRGPARCAGRAGGRAGTDGLLAGRRSGGRRRRARRTRRRSRAGGTRRGRRSGRTGGRRGTSPRRRGGPGGPPHGVGRLRGRRRPVVGQHRGDRLGRRRPPVRRHRDGGAEGDGVLRVGVDGDGATQLGADHLGDQRNARRAPDQQDRADLVVGHPGRADGPAERHDGLGDGGTDHRLELGAGQADLGLQPGQQHRDRHVGVARQRLLGVDALLPQARHRSLRRGLLGVEPVEPVLHGLAHVGVHGLVEVDAAEALHALGGADDLEPLLTAAHHGGVERAAPQVVHGDHRAGLEPALRGVERGRGDRFGQHERRIEVDLADRLGEEVELVRPPVGGVRERDGARRLALLLLHPVDRPAQQAGHQHLGGVRRSAEDDGRRVAHAALELAGHPAGVARGPPGGRLADQDLAVVAQVDDRRHRGGAVAEGEGLDHARPLGGRRRVGRAEIDPQVVRHFCSLGRRQRSRPGGLTPRRNRRLEGRTGR